jgi:hypothetical protein
MVQGLPAAIAELGAAGSEAAEDAPRSSAGLNAQFFKIIPTNGGDALLMDLAPGLELAQALGADRGKARQGRLKTSHELVAFLFRALSGRVLPTVLLELLPRGAHANEGLLADRGQALLVSLQAMPLRRASDLGAEPAGLLPAGLALLRLGRKGRSQRGKDGQPEACAIVSDMF